MKRRPACGSVRAALAAQVFAVFAALVYLVPLPASSGERIEGSYFPQPHLDLQARWAQPFLDRRMDPALANLIIAESPFTELRLRVPDRFIGRRVRIHMLVPPVVDGVSGAAGLEVEWKTQGILRPGRARPGERVLLFEGFATETPLRDFIAYTFRIDARFLRDHIRFEPHYEIEEH
ncbi:MAG TPA: hypothetical protein VIL43_13105 [Burkholderiales bacterium]